MEKKEISVFKWYLINISIWFFLTILFFYLIPLLVAQDHQIAIDFFNFKIPRGESQSLNDRFEWPLIIYLFVFFILFLIGFYTAFPRDEHLGGKKGKLALGFKIILISLNFGMIFLFKDAKNNLLIKEPLFLGFWWVQILFRIAIFSSSFIFIPISNLFFVAIYKKGNRFEWFAMSCINGRKEASEMLISHYLDKQNFPAALKVSEKRKAGFDLIVRDYLRKNNVSDAINFAEKNDNESLDYVVDFFNENGRFSEAIELNLKLKDKWNRKRNMEETAKESALAGQTDITNKAINQIIQNDRYKESSIGDWTILYEVAILLEEKNLFPEYVNQLLTSTKNYVLSFEDDYEKELSIEKFNDEVDYSKLPDDSKKRFKELFKE